MNCTTITVYLDALGKLYIKTNHNTKNMTSTMNSEFSTTRNLYTILIDPIIYFRIIFTLFLMLYSYIPTYILIFNLYYFCKTHATHIYCFVNKFLYSLLWVGYITKTLFLKAQIKKINYLLDLLNFLIYLSTLLCV